MKVPLCEEIRCKINSFKTWEISLNFVISVTTLCRYKKKKNSTHFATACTSSSLSLIYPDEEREFQRTVRCCRDDDASLRYVSRWNEIGGDCIDRSESVDTFEAWNWRLSSRQSLGTEAEKDPLVLFNCNGSAIVLDCLCSLVYKSRDESRVLTVLEQLWNRKLLVE